MFNEATKSNISNFKLENENKMIDLIILDMSNNFNSTIPQTLEEKEVRAYLDSVSGGMSNQEFLDNERLILKVEIPKYFDVKNMSNHSGVTPFSNIDLKPHLSKINECDVEKLMITIIDESNIIVESDVFIVGEFGKLEVDSIKIIEYVKNSKCKRFVVSHNHPLTVASCPSKHDLKMAEEIRQKAKIVNLEMIDFIVVTTFDIFSLEEELKNQSN